MLFREKRICAIENRVKLWKKKSAIILYCQKLWEKATEHFGTGREDTVSARVQEPLKKAKTTALWYIVNMMKYKNANLLVVRKVYRTLKDSCFTELKWAINRLGVSRFWEAKESPLEITYKPTGQKIFFRGLDDALKITSIAAEKGSLCWCWIEEAYEITSEDDFNMLDESIRGRLNNDRENEIENRNVLFKQITLTFNPWNEQHWLKNRFFDWDRKPVQSGCIKIDRRDEKAGILAITTDYTCNEWLDENDKTLFSQMKQNNPRRYRVAGLGDWGISEGLVYEDWTEHVFDIDRIRRLESVKAVFGLDFGYTNDPTALFCGLADTSAKTLWVFDELYKKGMSNEEIAKNIIAMGYAKEKIVADAAEPKSIDRLYSLGLNHIRSAAKGKDSINSGIDLLQDYHIIIHPKCVNFITEISNYSWEKDSLSGKLLNRPCDNQNHLMDAMRYAMEDCGKGNNFSFD